MLVYEDYHIEFTVVGFYYWLLQDPEAEVCHDYWETCALGDYLRTCTGYDDFMEDRYTTIIDAVDQIEHQGDLPLELRAELSEAEDKERLRTKGGIAEHIRTFYINEEDLI